MPSILTFKKDMVAYAVGRRANSEEWNTVTRTLESATLPFGAPAVDGTVKHSVVPLTAAGQNIIGISEAVASLPRPGDGFVQYDNVPLCQDGVIGVLLNDDVVEGAAARWNVTTQKWTDAAASATVFTVPGAQFEEAGLAGAVGLVRFRRPVPCVSA